MVHPMVDADDGCLNEEGETSFRQTPLSERIRRDFIQTDAAVLTDRERLPFESRLETARLLTVIT
jgi:hypothetical protein